MEDMIKKMATEFFKDEEVDDDERKEMEIYFEMFLEAVSSDDKKIEAMGSSILALANDEKFTPFELSSLCASLICEACSTRARARGIESSRIFFERIVDSMKSAMEEGFKEMENDNCKDDDCSCKC